MKIKSLIYSFILVLTLSNCQKDWGEFGLSDYDSLNGPGISLKDSAYYNPVNYDIDFYVEPDSLRLGSVVNITVEVLFKNKSPNFNILYFWRVNNNKIYTVYTDQGLGLNFTFDLFNPEINHQPKHYVGINANKVELSTSILNAVSVLGGTAKLPQMAATIKFAEIFFSLGLNGKTGEVIYCFEKKYFIPLYY